MEAKKIIFAVDPQLIRQFHVNGQIARYQTFDTLASV